MGRADYLALGDYNAQCYQCGFKRKASTMERNWQGYYVCPEHNEPRQAQDFVRGVPDMQNVPWSQPWPSEAYTYTDILIGIGDGITSQFQFGSGLTSSTYNVTAIRTDPFLAVSSWTVDSSGKVSLYATPLHLLLYPAPGIKIYATGTEILA